VDFRQAAFGRFSGVSLRERGAFANLAHTDQQSQRIDHFLLMHLGKSREELAQAREKLEELGKLAEKLTADPWHIATYVASVATPAGDRALVLHGSSQRVVGIDDGVALAELNAGQEVFLTNTLNLIVAKSPRGIRLSGETAFFDRTLSNGQLVVKWRDEEMIVDAAPALAATDLASGDMVRFESYR
jgi:hypothetical protein